MKRLILVSGNFDVLHPGHIRLLKFARECGDHLVVAVTSDEQMEVKSRVKQQHRLEVVNSLECVDEAFISTTSPEQNILRLKPYAVVKGKEHETQLNQEQSVLDSYGGKLIFGSGEFETNSEQYSRHSHSLYEHYDFTQAQRYAQRHNITQTALHDILDHIQTLRVAVIGEVIVDEYVHGTAVGISQEDPTIVMTPEKNELFLGGAAITAGHIKSLGADEVTLISVLGDDDIQNYVKNNIDKYQLKYHLLSDVSRPTPLKTRYRAGSKTLLRVNKLRQHKISKQLQDEIYKYIENLVNNIDLLVYSDFNYGILPQDLVNKISTLCAKYKVTMVADSQTSSQVGDISRYKNAKLLTPTEKEVRVALNNSDDGLVVLANKLCERANPENLVVTLAGEGVFIHIPDNKNNTWENDTLPAFNKNAIDPAGAGDCFLATSSLALCVGATPWHAFYLANLSSACQVSTLGNSPLKAQTLRHILDRSMRQQ
ncbi:adenylyltransferase/cytidyltransferase family protein [Pseudoalteromonas sp. MMG013]|uniref:PfkB family carbohydrate kinase n=1 Tax=Pseudoalteromonas sp. MMG013 TaxID=2822687 RepID=UPI001B38B531|nr:PfkB family carbohydrate kinase [Pseudoalteromonas sp. MMG013]MBQ4861989.1 adenylyltransferase/cytidyltransferase family protein [Pseudoalteromonas sp. MMG013]